MATDSDSVTNDKALILGIDPGTAICGYGLVRVGADDPELVTFGALTTPAGQPLAQRLLSLYGRLNELIVQYKPDEVAVEELFFNKNTTTALAVGQARGVILLAAAARGVPVYEYTPLQVKQALSGYGRATKEQVQEMVRLAFALDHAPQPDDAADALAIALCHSRSRRWHALGLTQ